MTAGVDTVGLPCNWGQSGPGRVQGAAGLGLRKWEPSGPSWRRGWEWGLLHPAVTPETPGAQGWATHTCLRSTRVPSRLPQAGVGRGGDGLTPARPRVCPVPTTKAVPITVRGKAL